MKAKKRWTTPPNYKREVEKKLDRIIELLEQIVSNTQPMPVIWPYVGPTEGDTGTWDPNQVVVTCMGCGTNPCCCPPYETVSVCCCSNPPGDGSTCAGGTCCCTSDYVCDKCRTKND